MCRAMQSYPMRWRTIGMLFCIIVSFIASPTFSIDVQTDSPISAPTQYPSSAPIPQPSLIPTQIPSDAPVQAPTMSPTGPPSQIPSDAPVSAPSISPSAFPTFSPTETPILEPTAVPSVEPSEYPTSRPTSAEQPRYFSCISTISACESYADGACSIYGSNVVLECIDDSTSCEVVADSFTVVSGTSVTVQGGCELIVNTTGRISVEVNSTITASAVHFISNKVQSDATKLPTDKSVDAAPTPSTNTNQYSDVSSSSKGNTIGVVIAGTITTSGLGPLTGPGSPTAAQQAGQGGSYGGSGGRVYCNHTYYSNFLQQIGSVNVFDDLYSNNQQNIALTLGSGGGFDGAGRGGGRIVIVSPLASVEVTSQGALRADGGAPSNAQMGGGSGGSIAIQANQFLHRGVLSAAGGSTATELPLTDDSGASGSGGRVAILISSLNSSLADFMGNDTFIRVVGSGQVLSGAVSSYPCKAGGSGTIFVQIISSATTYSSSSSSSSSRGGDDNTDTMSSSSIQQRSNDGGNDPLSVLHDGRESLVPGLDAMRSTSSNNNNNNNSSASAVFVANGGEFTYAATVLNKLPTPTTVLSISDLAVMATVATHSSSGTSTTAAAASRTIMVDSLFSLVNASYVILSNTTSAMDDFDTNYNGISRDNASSDNDDNNSDGDISIWSIAAKQIYLDDASMQGVENTMYIFNLTAVGGSVRILGNSSVYFSAYFRAQSDHNVFIDGTLYQIPHNDGNGGASASASASGAYFRQAMVTITASQNVSLGSTIVGNMKVIGNHVNIGSNKVLSPPLGYTPKSCQTNVSLLSFSCSNYQYTGMFHFNNTFAIVGNLTSTVGVGSRVAAAQILLCAPHVAIETDASVTADRRGCKANRGPGSGGMQSSPMEAQPVGGGGGGFGGQGGDGGNADYGNGGRSYSARGQIASGSGGGCFNCSSSVYDSAGGGFINIVANATLRVDGNVTANGAEGARGAGGGAGGSIFVDAYEILGGGRILARGGEGGAGAYPGGGGGGGEIKMFNYKSYYKEYFFTGELDASGGSAGKVDSKIFQSGSSPTSSIGVLYSSSSSSSPASISWPEKTTSVMAEKRVASALDDAAATIPATFTGNSGAAAISSSTGTSRSSTSLAYDATAGETGVIVLPTCPAGYGNYVSTGTVCGLCPAGTFSPGNGQNTCYECGNKPTHAFYTTSGWTTADCPYQCDPGYSTDDCYTPFQNFIFNTLGTVGLTLSVVGLFGLILLPLVYTRYKKEYVWFEEKDRLVLGNFGDGVSVAVTGELRGLESNEDEAETWGSPKKKKPSINSKRRTESFDEDYERGETRNPLNSSLSAAAVAVPGGTAGIGYISSSSSSSSRTNSVIAPAASSSSSSSTGDGGHSGNSSDNHKLLLPLLHSFQQRRRNKELRLKSRLVDTDLPKHAYRMNLLGSNHPMEFRGGAWRLPLSRPVCLRPMLRRDEYRAFAEKINRRMEWKPFGIEMMIFYAVAFIAPPLAALFMRQFRQRRAALLLRLISSYDHACFRCPRQRRSRNSLRMGISPDATLAYLDFLFDEDHFKPRTRPLCPLGQVKFPAAFKLAGLGTYYSPYYVDTNDLILQAVPQTDVPSSFINDAWIAFVVELNTVLRTIQSDAYYFGIRRAVHFLSNEANTKALGGVKVEICTFPNTESFYASEHSEMFPPTSTSTTPRSFVRSTSATTPARSVSGVDAAAGSLSHLHNRTPDRSNNRRSGADDSSSSSSWWGRLFTFGFIPNTTRDNNNNNDNDNSHINNDSSSGDPEASPNPAPPLPLSLPPLEAEPQLTASPPPGGAGGAGGAGGGMFRRRSRGDTEDDLDWFQHHHSNSQLNASAAAMAHAMKDRNDDDPSYVADRDETLPQRQQQQQYQPKEQNEGAYTQEWGHISIPRVSVDQRSREVSAAVGNYHPTSTPSTCGSSCSCCSCYRCSLGACVLWMWRLLELLAYRVQYYYCCCCCSTPMTFDPRDRSGFTLSFLQTCDAIRQGKLSLGIVVTHPKVANRTYIVQDDDYSSEEEDFYQYESRRKPNSREPGQMMRKQSNGRMDPIEFDDGPEIRKLSNEDEIDDNFSSEEEDYEDFDMYSFHSDSILGSVSGATAMLGSNQSITSLIAASKAPASGSSAASAPPPPTSGSTAAAALRRTYGDKADQVAKFYHIMVAADSNMAANPGIGGSAITSNETAHVASSKHSPTPSQSPSKKGVPPLHPSPSQQQQQKEEEIANADSSVSELSAHPQQQKDGKESIAAAAATTMPSEYTEFAASTGTGTGTGAMARKRTLGSIHRTHDSGYSDFGGTASVHSGSDPPPYSSNSSSVEPNAMAAAAEGRGGGGGGPRVDVGVGAGMVGPAGNQFTRSGSSIVDTTSGGRTAPSSPLPSPIVPLNISRVHDNRHPRHGKKNRQRFARKLKGLGGVALAGSAYQHAVNAWREVHDLAAPAPASEAATGGDITAGALNTSSNHILSQANMDQSNHDLSTNIALSLEAGMPAPDMSTAVATTSTAAAAALPPARTVGTGTIVSDGMLEELRRLQQLQQQRSYSQASEGTEAGSIASSQATHNSVDAPPLPPPATAGTTFLSVGNNNDGDDGSERNRDAMLLSQQMSASLRSGIAGGETREKSSRGDAVLFGLDLSDAAAADQELSRNVYPGAAVAAVAAPSSASSSASSFRHIYLFRLILFYFRQFIFGSNVYPAGPATIRKVLEIGLFILCVMDIGLSIIVLVGAYCASSDATACRDHTSMILMIAVWPGALVIAPVMGLSAVILGPSGTLARVYAMWSRLAGINSAMVVLALVVYYDYFANVPGSIYPMVYLPSSRALQCLFVDLYIAHIEKLRYTRGWDGLHTSLFKTTDNRQEINSS